jgi:hypothetical protein
MRKGVSCAWRKTGWGWWRCWLHKAKKKKKKKALLSGY